MFDILKHYNKIIKIYIIYVIAKQQVNINTTNITNNTKTTYYFKYVMLFVSHIKITN